MRTYAEFALNTECVRFAGVLQVAGQLHDAVGEYVSPKDTDSKSSLTLESLTPLTIIGQAYSPDLPVSGLDFASISSDGDRVTVKSVIILLNKFKRSSL